jgi:hypothetical protein
MIEQINLSDLSGTATATDQSLTTQQDSNGKTTGCGCGAPDVQDIIKAVWVRTEKTGRIQYASAVLMLIAGFLMIIWFLKKLSQL